MSDDAEEPAAKPAAPAGGAGKTSKAVLALLVLNLGASGFGAFKLVTAHPAAAATVHEEKHETNEKVEVTGPVVALDPFVVNLNEPAASRYLKVTMQAELVTHEAEGLLEKNKQVIRDAVLGYLSGLKLVDTLGAEAKDAMRAEVLKRIEAVVGEHKVRRLFFQEFVVQ